MTLSTICVVGAESTGKSMLAGALAEHFGVGAVTEYARAYCASHGNALTMEQLVHIGEVQDRNIRAAVLDGDNRGAPLVIADTDAIVTSVWAASGGEPLERFPVKWNHLTVKKSRQSSTLDPHFGSTKMRTGLDPWFGGELFESALYLVTENDLPWIDDGVRIQTSQAMRDRFREALTAELDRRGLHWVGIAGVGEHRLTRALAAIAKHCPLIAPDAGTR